MSRFLRLPVPEEIEEDPLSGVANLFDVSVVFIVSLMISLFSVYRMGDLVDPETEVTLVKTTAAGEQEIIVKKGPRIEARKITRESMSGEGVRLGIAYQLNSGEVIYVPEGPESLGDASESRR
ncbi:MAG: DUF2149 domain-containing protein [Acidobacteriota bacterium]